MYKETKYAGTTIRTSTKKGAMSKYWATAFNGIVTEHGRTPEEATRKAKTKLKNLKKK